MDRIYRTNRKAFECIICGKSHFARGYCRYHYNCYLTGRPMSFSKCSVDGCGVKVIQYIKEGLCSEHYRKSVAIPRYKNDGGKWGYKDYRQIRKLKKDRCELCGTKKKLTLHHIDKNPRNPNPSNLITVCMKCHMNNFHKKNLLF